MIHFYITYIYYTELVKVGSVHYTIDEPNFAGLHAAPPVQITKDTVSTLDTQCPATDSRGCHQSVLPQVSALAIIN